MVTAAPLPANLPIRTRQGRRSQGRTVRRGPRGPAADLNGTCSSLVGNPNCVDLFRLSTGAPILLVEGDKAGVIVLEDIEDETVTIGFGSPASEFGERAPESRKVIDTVKWRGS